MNRFANRVTERKRKHVCRYFDFLDLLTTYGPYLTRRDVFRIGIQLGLPEFATFNLPDTWQDRHYERPDGSIKRERWQEGQRAWFIASHQQILFTLIDAFIGYDEGVIPVLPPGAMNLACYLLTHTGANLRFVSRWPKPSLHESLMRRKDFLPALAELLTRGLFASTNTSDSVYQWQCVHR